MNIEEKAKAYDEAYKRVAVRFGSNVADEIFPELKESEDEKIRNFLIDFIKVCGWTEKKDQGWPLREECIAWLEKQGAQKPADKEYTFKAIPRLLGMIPPTDRAKSYCQKLIDSLEQEGYSTDAKIVRDCLKQMNGEKVAMATMDEQKPAWSEEDERMLHTIIADFKGFIRHNTSTLESYFNVCIDWLKSLKERYTWKPSIAQLNALSIVSKGNAPDDIEAIVSLYNDLKKLTE